MRNIAVPIEADINDISFSYTKKNVCNQTKNGQPLISHQHFLKPVNVLSKQHIINVIL